MYLPKHFEERDLTILHALIQAHPLGAWVVVDGAGPLQVNHVPCVLDATAGEFGTLKAHVARANPMWKALAAGNESVVIFQGPQAYVTPSWYVSKREHGKVVPTWNYAVVHAHGVPRAIDDAEWLRGHVQQLTAAHESLLAEPWQVSDAPADYIESMLKAIVGIELPIARLVGKWKVSQNRAAPDQRGVADGLTSGGDESRQMAQLVGERFREEST